MGNLLTGLNGKTQGSSTQDKTSGLFDGLDGKDSQKNTIENSKYNSLSEKYSKYENLSPELKKDLGSDLVKNSLSKILPLLTNLQTGNGFRSSIEREITQEFKTLEKRFDEVILELIEPKGEESSSWNLFGTSKVETAIPTKTINNQKQQSQNSFAPKKFGQVKKDSTVASINNNSGPSIQNKAVTKTPITQKLQTFISYISIHDIGTVKKNFILKHLENLQLQTQSYSYIEEHQVLNQNIQHIEEAVMGYIQTGKTKLNIDDSLLREYETERADIVNNAVTSKNALVTARGLADARYSFDTRYDDDIEEIDENISKDLLDFNGEIKKADDLKTIGLALKIDYRQDTPTKDQLAAYKERLSTESINDIKTYYNENDPDTAINALISDLQKILGESMKQTEKDIKDILKTDDLTITFQGKSITFTTLQERNFALSSTLYFVKGFAEDLEDITSTEHFYIFLGGIKDVAVFISSFGMSQLLGDYSDTIHAVFGLALLSYYTYTWGNNKVPRTTSKRLQAEYNTLGDKKKNDFFEGGKNEEYKDRFDTLDIIKKGIRIEVDAGNIPSEILNDILAYEKSYFTNGTNKLFYARLFKIIYSYDGKLGMFRTGLKFSIVPGWLGILEEMKGSPTLRGTDKPGFLGIRYLFNGKLGVRGAFDIMGSRGGSNIDLDQDVESFEKYLKDLAEHLKGTIKLDKFKYVALAEGEKKRLLDQMRTELDGIDRDDTSTLDKIGTRYDQIKTSLDEIVNNEKALGQFKAPINERISDLIGNIGARGSENFYADLKELQSELKDITGGDDADKGIIKKLGDISNEKVKRDIIRKIISGLKTSDSEDSTISKIHKSMSDIISISGNIGGIDRGDKILSELFKKIGGDPGSLSSMEKKVDILDKIHDRIHGDYTKILDKAFAGDKVNWYLITSLDKHYEEMDNIKKDTYDKKGKVTDTIDEKRKREKARFFDEIATNFTNGDVDSWTTHTPNNSGDTTDANEVTPRMKTGAELLDRDDGFLDMKKKLRQRYGVTNVDDYFNDILNTQYKDVDIAIDAVLAQLEKDGYMKRAPNTNMLDWAPSTQTDAEATNTDTTDTKETATTDTKEKRAALRGRDIYFNDKGELLKNVNARGLQAVSNITGIPLEDLLKHVGDDDTPAAARKKINAWLESKKSPYRMNSNINRNQLELILEDKHRMEIIDKIIRSIESKNIKITRKGLDAIEKFVAGMKNPSNPKYSSIQQTIKAGLGLELNIQKAPEWSEIKEARAINGATESRNNISQELITELHSIKTLGIRGDHLNGYRSFFETLRKAIT